MSRMALPTGLIVEDNPECRSWIAGLLQRALPGIQLFMAADCQQANALLDKESPAIALIDLGLPDGNGCSLIHRIKKEQIPCLCVVSTIFDDDEHVFTALKNGADGYLLKDNNETALLSMLQGIIEDKPPLSPAVARRMLDFFSGQQPTARHCLTTREIDILTAIGKGYTVAHTAELHGITYNTTASYVKEIYRKLNISSRAQAAAEAIRLGLVQHEY